MCKLSSQCNCQFIQDAIKTDKHGSFNAFFIQYDVNKHYEILKLGYELIAENEPERFSNKLLQFSDLFMAANVEKDIQRSVLKEAITSFNCGELEISELKELINDLNVSREHFVCRNLALGNPHFTDYLSRFSANDASMMQVDNSAESSSCHCLSSCSLF